MKKLIIALHDKGIASAIAAGLECLAADFELHLFTAEQGQPVVMLAMQEIKKIAPVAVVCGLSAPKEGERKVDRVFLQAAVKLGVPTIGILEPAFMAKALVKKRFNAALAAPQRLVLASERMKKQMMDFGFAEKQLTVLPMPKYAQAIFLRNSDSDEWRRLNEIPDGQVVVVFSTSATPEADRLALGLLNEAAMMVGNVAVRLCFHPKETPEMKDGFGSLVAGSSFLKTADSGDLVAAAALARGGDGLLLGVKSSLLFDGLLAGCNVVSVNPGQNPDWRSQTAELGLAPEVVTAREIRRKILSVQANLFRKGGRLPELFVDEKAPQHFAAGLKEIIEQGL